MFGCIDILRDNNDNNDNDNNNGGNIKAKTKNKKDIGDNAMNNSNNIDFQLDEFYAALEYREEDADGEAIDVGKSPLQYESKSLKTISKTPASSSLNGKGAAVTSNTNNSNDATVAQTDQDSEQRDQPPSSSARNTNRQNNTPVNTSSLLPSPPSASLLLSPLPPPPPPPPQQQQEVPDRFLRAANGNAAEAKRRFQETLEWRQQNGMDSIISEPHPHFALIKEHYPHYFHLRSHQNQPVFFEKPPKTDLRSLRRGGVTLPTLLRHYAMITEFGWQVLERDDAARCVTVIDLDGIRMTDFVGECVDFVRKTGSFTGRHYPDRTAQVLILHTPGWFNMIWKIVKPMIDPMTLERIQLMPRGGNVFQTLLRIMPPEHIPPEYGGTSMPLGESPEEKRLWDFVNHNNRQPRCNREDCQFCQWEPVRNY